MGFNGLVLKFNSGKEWRVMLCEGNSELRSFQEDSLSPLVFVLVLISLSLILRKTQETYEFPGRNEKIDHSLFMYDLKLYSRNGKGLNSLVQTTHVFSEDTGMEFGTEKCATLVSEKRKILKSV